MTRDQIPGISAHYEGEFLPEASWGLGWNVHSHKRCLYDAALYSAQAFRHAGATGTLLWVDPAYDLVGAYFSAVLQQTPDGRHRDWPVDLFINAVTAAVVDV